MHWRRKWQPTPVFLPGESQGQGSLVTAVSGVAQSWTRLKRLSSSSSSRRRCSLCPSRVLPLFICSRGFPYEGCMGLSVGLLVPVLLISKSCLVCRLTVHWLAGLGQEAADCRTQERPCPEAVVGPGDLKAAYHLVGGSVHLVSCLT